MDYKEHYKKLVGLISTCYEKNKSGFTSEERESCEMFLYKQGEYEIALDEIEAILNSKKIELGEECKKNILEARRLMGLSILKFQDQAEEHKE